MDKSSLLDAQICFWHYNVSISSRRDKVKHIDLFPSAEKATI